METFQNVVKVTLKLVVVLFGDIRIKLKKGVYMDTNVIQTMISTLGFPIVTTIAMGWFISKLWNQSQEQNKQREDKLYEVVSKAQAQNERLSITNSEFVKVLNDYKTDLETIKNDVKEIKTQFN
jgi:cell division protein FtsB